MRLSSYYLTIAIAILAGIFPAAGTASAQECPTVEVNCSTRMAGNSDPLRCQADVKGDVADMKLNYQWESSPQVPLKTIPGRPDGIDVDLSGNPQQQITVMVTITGLPKDCQSAAQFNSLPEVSETDDSDPEEPDEAQASAPTERPAPPPSMQIQTPNASSIMGTCAETVIEGALAYFSVKVSDSKGIEKPLYNWTITRGKIKSGQGTPFIAVDTTDLGGNLVTATAQAVGSGTALRVSCTTVIKRIPRAYKLNEIKRATSDEENVHLRRFALRLNIGLEERAYIVAIGKRGQSVEQLRRRAESIRDYLIELCGVAPNRILGLGVGFSNDEAIQLWVVQNGARPPQHPMKAR